MNVLGLNQYRMHKRTRAKITIIHATSCSLRNPKYNRGCCGCWCCRRCPVETSLLFFFSSSSSFASALPSFAAEAGTESNGTSPLLG